MEKISVAIRVRPPSKAVSPAPYGKGHKWSIGPHNVALYSTLGTPVNGQNYSFDHVFGGDAKNGDIHKGLTKDVIMSAVNGFNGTVFAYGQTSSGKTYTMKGTPTDPGVIRLAVHDVFGHIRQMAKDREYLIRVSYMEIYNEDISDLLVPDNRRLRVHENLEKGIFVAGLREEIVDSPEKVFDLMEFGESHRHFGETNMNLYSSRSHTIFRMVIESRDKSQDGFETEASSDAVRVSCLNMVDLAGSERIAKTGAGGVRLKEGTHINKSLMTLGTVINKLSDGTGKQGGHIPYRDSKLTRILQPALGGNAKTAMICTVTPDEIHIDETRGTLQFASRAKRVSTCAQINEIVTDAALLKRQTKEIEELRMKLQGLPQSAHLEKEILNLRNELLKFELEKERLYLELREEKKAQVARERRIKEQEQKIENLSTLFMSSTLDDRDGENFPKKVNRRETWCPRPLSLQRTAQDFSRSSADQNEDDETIDNILFTMKRDRNFTLPPAFEIDEEEDSCWPRTETEESEPPSDFENIADEDTWMSLNKGHTTSSGVFAPGVSDSSASTGSTGQQKVVLLENQLRDLQLQYHALQMSCDVKIQEANQDLKTEVGKIKLEMNQVQNENLILTNELSCQLEVQKELQQFVADLEYEMDAARLQTASMQSIFSESLHVQSNILNTIQECLNLACKHPGSGQKAKERTVSQEGSVKKCRPICAEEEDVLLDRPLHTHGTDRRSTMDGLEQDRVDRDIRQIAIDMDESGNDVGIKAIGGVPRIQVSDGQPGADVACRNSSSRDAQYCESCMSSIIPTSRTWDDEPATVNDDSTHLVAEADEDESAADRLCSDKMRNADHEAAERFSHGGVSLSDRGCESLSCLRWNGVKVHALRALASRDETHRNPETRIMELGNGDVGPSEIWNGYTSSDHTGCSFGTLGSNCDKCAYHERGIQGKDEITTAMSKLCGLILELFEPSFFMSDTVRVNQGETKGGAHQSKKLKIRLANAKLLATWLVEEVDAILGHDLGCLSRHVRKRGSVGVVLEALQVLLLQLANMSIGLLRATCQDEDLVKNLMQQLTELRDGRGGVAPVTATTGLPLSVDALPEILLPQEERESDKNTRTNYCATDKTEIETFMDSADAYSGMMFSDRVAKVEGVEQVLGKVLQSSMTLLRKKQRVVKGDPLLLVLTLELEEYCQEAAKLQRIHVGATSREICWIFHDDNLGRTKRRSDSCFPSGKLDESIVGSNSAGSKCANIADVVHRTSGDGDEREPRIGVGDTTEERVVGERCEVVTLSFCQDRSDGRWVEAANDIHDNSAARLVMEAQKVRKLEMRLAEAELGVVELKIEVEELRAKLQSHGEIGQDGAVQRLQSDLQVHKEKCAKYEKEIRLLLGQFPNSSAEIFQRERLLMEVMAENQFLQTCLVKAKKHVLRSKAWRDEIRKWKDMEVTRREIRPEAQVQDPASDLNDNLSENNKVMTPVVAEVLDEEPPPPGTESDIRPARAALRPLNSNTPSDIGCVDSKHHHSKRRRQLRFSADNMYAIEINDYRGCVQTLDVEQLQQLGMMETVGRATGARVHISCECPIDNQSKIWTVAPVISRKSTDKQ